ncbi:HAD family hydrolase [Actinobaculum suis]|uniref:HAD-IIA family hydrolase n=1 Tax=Actinobaculum suis TaxID=1657 RepID=UPI00066FB7BB|nr:HAD-IIA family hydrolase [Actinobaculum suis]KMY22633.1 HAD family hydrolase [Actinobaculum suis]
MQKPFAQNYDGALFDLDGVAYLGGDPVPHAAEGYSAARAAGMKAVFVTNNASRPPETVAAQLNELGLETRPEDILTSAQAAVLLAQQLLPEGAKVLVIGGAGLHEAMKGSGFQQVTSADDNPAAVIEGFYPEIGWKQLSEAALAIQKGARFIATNLDATLPQERGHMIGNGSLVAAIVNATGVQPTSPGKPDPGIYKIAAEKLGAQNPFAVGDRLNTDVRGAVAAGIPSLHVLTGVNSARDIMLAVPEERPTFLADDLRALNEVYPQITKTGDTWTCGEETARLVGTKLEISNQQGDQIFLNAYRAAVHAVWEAIDAGLARETLGAELPDYQVVRPGE